jgi:hypothetical protein
LVREISHGRRVFDEILIFTDASLRIINDTKAADFFVAIINENDGAMPDLDPAELAAWRIHVWHDAPPALSGPEPQAEHGSAGGSRPSTHVTQL